MIGYWWERVALNAITVAGASENDRKDKMATREYAAVEDIAKNTDN